MGSISGLLGTAGGAGGSGFSGPQNAQIDKSATVGQATDQYGNVVGGLGQQQNFLNAVTAQNGLGNQTSTFNQLQGVANGTGPNPAQAQLAQATGANTANQAALMAGQRGSGQNAGLIARQASMQGGANQQNAAGQAATMQANQSLNALNSMGSLANTQAAQQSNATNAYSQAAQNAYQGVTGNINAQNNAAVGNQSSINAANAGLANTTLQGQQGAIGGLMNGAGAAMGAPKGANGGIVQKFADGSTDIQATTPTAQEQSVQQAQGPRSSIARLLSGAAQGQPQAVGNYGNPGANALAGGVSNAAQGMMAPTPTFDQQLSTASLSPATPQNDPTQQAYASGGEVKALVSPGEQYLNPKEAKEVIRKGKDPLKTGERIPGKPKVSGAKNSYANDTVSKKLEEGGIVIPRSVTQGENARHEALKFVYAHFKGQGLAKGKK